LDWLFTGHGTVDRRLIKVPVWIDPSIQKQTLASFNFIGLFDPLPVKSFVERQNRYRSQKRSFASFTANTPPEIEMTQR